MIIHPFYMVAKVFYLHYPLKAVSQLLSGIASFDVLSICYPLGSSLKGKPMWRRA